MQMKRAGESVTTMTEVVLPNDANPMGILLGGRLLYWMDIAAAICAQTHTGRICVTASLDHVAFDAPIRVGEVVYLEAHVTRTFTTSMEIYVQVWMSGLEHSGKVKTNEAFFTFVAKDEYGKTVEVPEMVPETEQQRKEFDEALSRREERLRSEQG